MPSRGRNASSERCEPPKGIQAASKFSELERPRWQRGLSQSVRFFFWGNCSSECYVIVIVLHVLGYSSGKTTLGAPEPREDEGLTQATHGFVGEGTLSQVWPFLC